MATGTGPGARRRACAFSAALLLALLFASASFAGDVLEGRVVSVHDGDTITLLVGNTTVKVRLAGIDTPEQGQPWAKRARQALVDRVFGKEVRVIAVTIDAYGRTVGEVYADNVCVGCELVREGHAWVYRKYSDDPVLLRLEADARANHRGLWSLPESQRVPPWEWRHGQRRRADTEHPSAADFKCGTKRYCREMRSCAEARFYLEQCGLTRLDGDGDGVPCESVCGGRQWASLSEASTKS
jgi:endonuclease YncB( thermonuclease family)